jgi:hypothetical protein
MHAHTPKDIQAYRTLEHTLVVIEPFTRIQRAPNELKHSHNTRTLVRTSSCARVFAIGFMSAHHDVSGQERLLNPRPRDSDDDEQNDDQ